MKITIDVPDYNGVCLIHEWDEESKVLVEVFQNNIIHIQANAAGLTSLAKNMIYLASSVGPERHFHYDESNCGHGFHGNLELIISRSDTWE